MKIYTRTGDAGKTSLLSGERVSKCHVRIDACGDIDELNSWIGVVLLTLPDEQSDVKSELLAIQSDLLDMGAFIATTAESSAADGISGPAAVRTRALEDAIDRFDSTLEPLTRFILPGGSPASAWAHVSRTVCRRAERRVIAARSEVEEKPEIFDESLQYLNRLSDFLFALARYCNHITAQPDQLWQPEKNRG
jgi:cob(I)alamin adenosyltransferase